jgi:transposase
MHTPHVGVLLVYKALARCRGFPSFRVFGLSMDRIESRRADSNRLPPRGFQVLPRRWVVERTFSWLEQNRRMSKDYERLCATGEAFIYVAMTRLMVRRLTRV